MTLPTAYLAPISWYQAYLSEQAEIEIFESFPKRTLRNRCLIVGTNGVQTLTVPVERADSKQLTKDVKIAYQTRWQHQHLNALISAYRHTPFFDYLFDLFEPAYLTHFTYLIDLNEALHTTVMKCLTLNLSLNEQYHYTTEWRGLSNIDRVFEQGSGGNDNRRAPAYYQIFADRHGFQPNLSIIDLLFNEGTEAVRTLRC